MVKSTLHKGDGYSTPTEGAVVEGTQKHTHLSICYSLSGKLCMMKCRGTPKSNKLVAILVNIAVTKAH